MKVSGSKEGCSESASWQEGTILELKNWMRIIGGMSDSH